MPLTALADAASELVPLSDLLDAVTCLERRPPDRAPGRRPGVDRNARASDELTARGEIISHPPRAGAGRVARPSLHPSSMEIRSMHAPSVPPADVLPFAPPSPEPVLTFVNHCRIAGGVVTAIARVWPPGTGYCGLCPREICCSEDDTCLVCVKDYIPADDADLFDCNGRPIDWSSMILSV